MCRAGLVQLDFIFGCRVSSGHPSHCRSSSVLLDLFLRMSSGCFTFLIVSSSGGHPSKCRPGTGAAGLHLRLSRLPAVTHPTADRARCGAFFFECFALPFSSIVSSSGRHPSMCRSRPGATGLHLQLVSSGSHCSSAWPFSSIVFSSGGHPSECRPFLVLLVTHPTADRARCCLTFSFDCLLFRRSPISPDLAWCLDFIFGCRVFRRSPIPLPTEPVLLDLFLRLDRFTHLSSGWCFWTSCSAVRFRRSPIPLLTEPGAA